jgi:hypothetical protein
MLTSTVAMRSDTPDPQRVTFSVAVGTPDAERTVVAPSR